MSLVDRAAACTPENECIIRGYGRRQATLVTETKTSTGEVSGYDVSAVAAEAAWRGALEISFVRNSDGKFSARIVMPVRGSGQRQLITEAD